MSKVEELKEYLCKCDECRDILEKLIQAVREEDRHRVVTCPTCLNHMMVLQFCCENCGTRDESQVFSDQP